MGMIDEIYCDAEMPDDACEVGTCFQTKSFPNPCMHRYWITASGRFVDIDGNVQPMIRRMNRGNDRLGVGTLGGNPRGHSAVFGVDALITCLAANLKPKDSRQTPARAVPVAYCLGFAAYAFAPYALVATR